MEDTCFMAPIHRKGFEYGLQYVLSYNKYYDDNDLFLVFSTQDEIDDFRKLIGPSARYNPILCTEPLTYSKPISQKKLFGVKHILNTTSFNTVAVTDVDCVFIKNVNYHQLIGDRIQRKKIFTSKTSNRSIIDKVGRAAAIKFFSPDDVQRLEEITRGFTDYFWFNEIPFYQRRYFEDFAHYIKYPQSIDKLEYTTFDYILYVYYLLLKSHVHLEPISVEGIVPLVQDKGSFIEAQASFKPAYYEKAIESFQPLWMVTPIDSSHKDVMIRLHVDRG